ncbi:MAG: M42 family metallopeptidase [Fusobacteriaceae bacterium]|nr:M42 family metallopeptidase [Fusobacteriaceae bacterium]
MSIDMEYILHIANKLLSVPSPSGYTDNVMKIIEEELKSFNVKFQYTKKHALIGFINGKDNTYKKMISAHVDTIGAVVEKIKDNGRLKLSNIGRLNWSSLEGENLKVITNDNKEYDGTLIPTKASVHIYPIKDIETPRSSENMEVRLDEDVKTKKETEDLGITPGDFVFFDTRTKLTKTGYLKSRYLDAKLCVAQLLGYIKFLSDNKILPNTDLYIYFSNYEEIGHGISFFPNGLNEFISLDVGLANNGTSGDEKKVSICAKDSRTVYDYNLKKRLIASAEENEINYTVDIYNKYGSDASVAISQGHDFVCGCIGPAIDASHHYERTHLDGVAETIKLLLAYL